MSAPTFWRTPDLTPRGVLCRDRHLRGARLSADPHEPELPVSPLALPIATNLWQPSTPPVASRPVADPVSSLTPRAVATRLAGRGSHSGGALVVG